MIPVIWRKIYIENTWMPKFHIIIHIINLFIYRYKCKTFYRRWCLNLLGNIFMRLENNYLSQVGWRSLRCIENHKTLLFIVLKSYSRCNTFVMMQDHSFVFLFYTVKSSLQWKNNRLSQPYIPFFSNLTWFTFSCLCHKRIMLISAII